MQSAQMSCDFAIGFIDDTSLTGYVMLVLRRSNLKAAGFEWLWNPNRFCSRSELPLHLCHTNLCSWCWCQATWANPSQTFRAQEHTLPSSQAAALQWKDSPWPATALVPPSCRAIHVAYHEPGFIWAPEPWSGHIQKRTSRCSLLWNWSYHNTPTGWLDSGPTDF